jgi:serine/threonine-protein kinase
MANLIGHSLGRYHILEQLGEGGMAIVYKARDTRLEADVAVKIIRTENILPSALGRTLKRFEREAKALARLTHPNIVKVTDYGEHEGKPYLVMPLLSGGTLKSKLNGNPMPWQDAVKILLPIADALGYAHKHDIIHRDVKPANILITENGQPMLADFGVAKMLDVEETMELTGTGVGIGTPEYMAPEQVTNKQMDARADIYALGVVLFEMVTGRKPFIADTPMAVLIMHSRDPLPRPKSFAPNLPQAVENIIIKSLVKKPEDRYQNMADFAKAMEGLSGGKKISDPKVNKDEKRTEFKLPAVPRRVAITVGLIALGFGLFAFFLPTLKAIPATLFPTATTTKTSTPSFTFTPGKTSTPVFTATPSNTSTPIFTATPALQDEITDEKGVTMRLVPAGEFTMGSNDGEADEKPVHTVYLGAFYMDKYEVTNALYKACVDARVCEGASDTSSSTRSIYYGNPEFDNYPVIHVDWSMARSYCSKWRGGRLPTEAEWEKAARGIDARIYPWGNDAPNDTLLNAKLGDTAQVGSYESGKSPYGIYDMAGNVSEWVSSLYQIYPYDMNDGRENLSASGQRMYRGGDWGSSNYDARSAFRVRRSPFHNNSGLGFRCASTP